MDEFIVGFISTIATVVISIATLAYWLGRKFSEIDARFRLIDERFKGVEERFRQIDERFRQIDERFRQIDERFVKIEERLSRVEARLDRVEARLDRVESELTKLRDDVQRMLREHGSRILSILRDFATTIKHSQEFVIEMLSYEGVLRKEAADVVRAEVRRIYEGFIERLPAFTNPLTKQELEEIRRYIEKEELTIEEAKRFKELAAKLVEEYASQYPDLWKIYWYAVFWVGLSARLAKERAKHAESREKQ